jgi:drug/metabolite transporter (DMT)-like permease
MPAARPAIQVPQPSRPNRSAGTRWVDALLVLMVLIWGVNYSVIKHAFAEIPPQPFNALRVLIASTVFLIAMWVTARRANTTPGLVSTTLYRHQRVTAADWRRLIWLGFVGHFIYQFCFVGGVDKTSVDNAALIIGVTPVAVAVMSAALGRERIGRLHWLGAAVSAFGIYFVVGNDLSFGGTTLQGDLMVMTSVACWSIYTTGASTLIARHSPLFVTGTTMVIGGIPYALVVMPQVLRVDWARVSDWTLVSLVLSALFALCLAYLIWYTAIQKIGPARTSMYSNLVPIAAMSVAAVWLGETITGRKLIGATAVLVGVLLTRLGKRAIVAVPLEE